MLWFTRMWKTPNIYVSLNVWVSVMCFWFVGTSVLQYKKRKLLTYGSGRNNEMVAEEPNEPNGATMDGSRREPAIVTESRSCWMSDTIPELRDGCHDVTPSPLQSTLNTVRPD